MDIEHSESVAAMRSALGEHLADLGLTDLTVSTLRSEDRVVTTTIAEWVHRQVLDDGSLPHGIRYRCIHGTDWHCWALWLRAVDDGRSVRREPTKSDHGLAIEDCSHNPELRDVARLFRLTIW